MIDYYTLAKKKLEIHDKSMNTIKFRNDFLSALNILLVSFAGIANNVTYIKNIDSNAFSVLFSGILYSSLVVTGVQKYLNYDELVEKHRVSSILYATLCQNIDDGLIPVQYIRSQYQMLKAMEPYTAEPETLTSFDNLDNLSFEINRADNDS